MLYVPHNYKRDEAYFHKVKLKMNDFYYLPFETTKNNEYFK